MSHPDCPRQIVFTLPGAPGVRVTATEVGGAIEFTIDVDDALGSTGDLRALFFEIDENELPGLTVNSSDPLLTQWRVGDDAILDMGQGANLKGEVKTGFDVGLEWGTPGGGRDDINFPVEFSLSNATGDLKLDDLGGMLFGARLNSIGGPGGPSGSSSKLTTIAPFAPDAIDDWVTIFEDNAADLNSPSKSPTAVVVNVIGNDTDGDSPPQTLTLDHIIEGSGPLHGTVEIIDNMIHYTPHLDYSGTDEFWYCMTDGNGGQDSAKVTVNITAVADDPLISFEVAQGAHINETLVTVTATQNDADGSETIGSLDWAVAGGVPAGVTITPAGPVASSGSQVVQQFVVTTAAEQDWNFDIAFTASSVEASNGDMETHTANQNIDIQFTNTQSSLTYAVDDQSIWDNGPAYFYDLEGEEGFFGISIGPVTDGDVYEVASVDVAGWNYAYGLTAGFQLDVHIEGGSIDASVPVDVTIDATYNHTTDTIYIDSFASLGSGGSFLTSGPEGSLDLDFVFKYLMELHAWSDLLPVGIDFGPYQSDPSSEVTEIIDLDTSDPAYSWDLLPGIVSLIAEWPHIDVANDPGVLSGDAFSNFFLALQLDVDALANNLLGGLLSWVDADPTTEDNFEVFDLDLVGGLRLLQEFAIGLGAAAETVNLVLEDNSVMAMTLGTGLWIEDASTHDVNNDGVVSFSFELTPDVELTNNTYVDVALEAELAIIRNLDLLVTEVTVYNNDSIPIANVPIEVYGNTFDLDGVGGQNVMFFA